jgi:hypothetical protein
MQNRENCAITFETLKSLSRPFFKTWRPELALGDLPDGVEPVFLDKSRRACDGGPPKVTILENAQCPIL